MAEIRQNGTRVELVSDSDDPQIAFGKGIVSPSDSATDLVFYAGGVERARIATTGIGTGLFSGSGSLPVLNVATQYGAVGDGATDNTAALVAALAAQQTQKLPIYIPPGVFNYDGGSVAKINHFAGISFLGAGENRSILVNTNTAGKTGLQIDLPSGTVADESKGLLLQDFTLRGNASSGDGFVLSRSGTQTIGMPSLVRFRSDLHGGHGVRVTASVDWMLCTSCEFTNCGGNGFYNNTGSALMSVLTFLNSHASGNTGDGLFITGAVDLFNVIAGEYGHNVNGVHVNDSEGTPIQVHIAGTRHEGNTNRQIYVQSAGTSVTLDGQKYNDTTVSGLAAQVTLAGVGDSSVKLQEGFSLPDACVVVEEVTYSLSPLVAYSQMENAIKSQKGGATTGYIRKDKDGNLYSSLGQHVRNVSHSVSAVSSSTSLAATSSTYFEVSANTGARVVTLPDATHFKGRVHTVKKTDSSGNAVTITPQAGQLVDGAATYALTKQFMSASFYSNGTGWSLIGRIAAADLVNPATGVRDMDKLSALGVIAETFNPMMAGGNSALATGDVFGSAVYLYINEVVSNILVQVGVAASGATPTLLKLGLADASGNVVAVTADTSADSKWTATGTKFFALSPAYTVPVGGLYYLLILEVGAFATPVQLVRGISSTIAGGGPTGFPRRAGNTTGATDLAVNDALTLGGTVSSTFYLACN